MYVSGVHQPRTWIEIELSFSHDDLSDVVSMAKNNVVESSREQFTSSVDEVLVLAFNSFFR